MVIRIIVCPICKEKINSFYASTGACPVCKGIFNTTRQKVSNTGLSELRKAKRQHKKDTMTRGQVKRMFKFTNEEMVKIPSTDNFGETRYYKIDVANFVKK